MPLRIEPFPSGLDAQVGSTSSAAVDPLPELGDIAKVRFISLNQHSCSSIRKRDAYMYSMLEHMA